MDSKARRLVEHQQAFVLVDHRALDCLDEPFGHVTRRIRSACAFAYRRQPQRVPCREPLLGTRPFAVDAYLTAPDQRKMRLRGTPGSSRVSSLSSL